MTPWRVPAEWEPHESTWLVWPHAESTWPTVGLEAAREFFCGAVRLIGAAERVDLVVRDPDVREAADAALRRAGVDLAPVRFREVVTDDSWVRDFGPTWRVDAAGRRSAACWRFNAWGGKYPPYEADAAAGETIARLAAEDAAEVGRIQAAGFVLEGGSIDVDGRGRLITTERCLLNANREAGRTKTLMEARLREWLGVRDVLWLEDGIAGDDTDGHVDDCARFGADGTLLVAVETDRGDANFHPLEFNRVRASEWAADRGVRVRELPMPGPVTAGGQRLPASYANYLVCNGRVIVPVFGDRRDGEALRTIQAAHPGREVLAIPSRSIVEGLGSIHCLSQQRPAGRRD